MHKLKTLLCIVTLVICSLQVMAQYLVQSNAYIQTCIQKTHCFSNTGSAYVFFDESKDYIYLKVDMNKFKIGQDSLDEWLNDMNESFLYVKAPASAEALRALAPSNFKTSTVNAQVFLNNTWHQVQIELTFISNRNASVTQITSGSIFENLRVNMAISIAPKEFNLHKKPHHLKKTIFIGIAMGTINTLLPEMRSLLGEAYNH
jgi:hypothetical protein